MFPNLKYHQWIKFGDRNGKEQWAEPEAYIVLEGEIILFECKRTGSSHGKKQMDGLYKPLLEYIYGKPVRCLLVVKYLTNETPGPIYANPESFIMAGGNFGTWHRPID